MTLMNRMSRLFKADVHGLLDQLEEPEALLKQAVRDMEEELGGRRAALARGRAEVARVAQRLARIATERDGLAAQLALCLESGKDDLARGVLRRKLEAERLATAFEARRTEGEAGVARLAAECEAAGERLAQVRQKMELVLARTAAGDAADPTVLSGLGVTDDDVEIALLTEKERRARGAGKHGAASAGDASKGGRA